MTRDLVDVSPAVPTAPYAGLGYYTEERADVFFGRDAERKVIITNLRAARLTVLYAQSGVGKSSLLRAGVVPRLRDAARGSYARRGHAAHIPVVFSSWRDEPLAEFRSELERAIDPFRRDGDHVELPGASLRELFSAAVAATDATLLVILDQFEEYFLYRSSEQRPGQCADEIADSINTRGLRTNFLIAVREDAYAGVGDVFNGKLANVYGNYLHLEHLDRDAAREAIVRPVERFNDERAPGDSVAVEPELVESILDEVRTGQVVFEQAGKGIVPGRNGADSHADAIETPYLQLVMATLWQRELGAGSRLLQLATLTRLGGAQEIVRTHLDSALAALSDQQRELAVDIFDRLVTPSGTKIVHRIPDLAAYSGRDPAEVEALVEQLTGGAQRILRPVPAAPGEDGTPRVEIFHDVLAPAVLAWRTAYAAERLQREKHEAEQAAAHERTRARAFRALASVATLLLIVGIVAVIVAEVVRARNAQHVAQSRLVASEGSAGFELGTLDRGVLLSMAAYRIAHTSAARDGLMQGLERTRGMVAYFSGHTGPVSSVAFSPDGRTLASASADETVELRSVSTGRRLRSLRGHTGVVESVAFSADGRTLASASADRTIVLWDVPTGGHIRTLRGHTGTVYGVAFSPDGRTVASASADRTVALWDVATGRRIRTLRGHTGTVYGVAFSPDGRTVASASADRTIGLWDVATGQRIRTLRGHRGTVYGVAFDPAGGWLASASADRTVIIWDLASGRAVHTLRGHSGGINGVAFSPTGRFLASAGSDRTVGVWDPASGQLVRFLRGQTRTIESVAFSPNGRTIASGSDDESVVLWGVTGPQVRSLDGHRPVLSVAFSRDGRQLASAADDGSVVVWDVNARQPVRVLVANGGEADAVAYSPDGRTLAAASSGGSVTIWDASTGRSLGALSGGTAPLYGIAFSPDGGMLAAASDDGSVIVWDIRRGRLLHRLRIDNNPLFAVAFSPDQRTVAAGGADGAVTLWDANTGQRLRTLSAHTAAVESVAFSANGKMLASGSDDRTIILWDVATGHQLGDPLRAHQDDVTGVAFSPDGKKLASGSRDGSVIVWSTATRFGQPVHGHSGPVTSVAFSSTGMLASGSTDHTVDLSNPLPPSEGPAAIYARLCGVVRRNLTSSEWRELVPGRHYARTCAAYS